MTPNYRYRYRFGFHVYLSCMSERESISLHMRETIRPPVLLVDLVTGDLKSNQSAHLTGKRNFDRAKNQRAKQFGELCAWHIWCRSGFRAVQAMRLRMEHCSFQVIDLLPTEDDGDDDQLLRRHADIIVLGIGNDISKTDVSQHFLRQGRPHRHSALLE